MLEKRFDDDWFLGYRSALLEPSTFAFTERQPHLVHTIIHSARLGGGVDRHIDHELRRLPPRHAGAVRAHMQLYRACLLATGLVPADTLVNVAVQIEWFWYNTAFTAFYRDHLAHVMKVAAIGLSLFRDADGPLADGAVPLVESVARGLASYSLGNPAIRATALRAGNPASVLRDPAFWRAAVLETIRLAGLLHDMAHPAVIASKMTRIAAPSRPLAPFEPTERDMCRQTVAAFGHRLLAAPFNRGELPSASGITGKDAEACAEVFLQSHSLRAGYAIARLAEEAGRVWQLSPFDAFVMEWAALAVSLHDYDDVFALRRSERPEDQVIRAWFEADPRNVEAVRPCFERDPVSYILALADQIQDFGRVLGPTDTRTVEADRIESSVRYPVRSVTLRVDPRTGDEARLIYELGRDDGTCFGATEWDYALIEAHKRAESALYFGERAGEPGWLDHRGLFASIAVEIRRAPSRSAEGDLAPGRRADPVRLFYSFADADEALRKTLETHLSNLKWQGVIADWHHRRIDPGAEVQAEVDEHLAAADILLLLVSADFLASEYCRGVELAKALALHRSGMTRVIPVLVRRVDLAYAPFADLEALPSNGVPVKSWANEDDAWTDVVQGIRRVVEQLRGAPPGAARKSAREA